MKPSELMLALKTNIQAKRPAMVWGDPGVGKSRMMQQVAREMGLAYHEIRFSGRDTVDLLGLPIIKNDQTRWAVPHIFPTKGPALIFCDEINRATQSMLNMALQLVQDRSIGDYIVPPEVVVMAAGNYETDPGVIKMSSAMRLRFTHLDAQTDLSDWCKWALTADVDPIVIAFMRWKDELLHKFDPKARVSPNPRAWEFVSDLVKANPDPRVEHGMIVGNVGEAAGTEFSGFRRLFKDLPSIDAIVLEPKKTQVPTEPSTRYAIAAALARRATATNLGRIIQYLERMPVEYNVLTMKLASGLNNGAITHTPEYVKWNVVHSDVTL